MQSPDGKQHILQGLEGDGAETGMKGKRGAGGGGGFQGDTKKKNIGRAHV